MGKELNEIVAEMRALGVTKYKNGDIEVELGKSPTVTTIDNFENQARVREMNSQDEHERKLRIMFGASSIRPNVRKVMPSDG